MEILKAKKKKMIEGREKPLWIDVGFTVLVGDWQGKTTYTLIDERTGEKYSLFKNRPKSEWDADRPAPDDSGAEIATSGPIDPEDVPF